MAEPDAIVLRGGARHLSAVIRGGDQRLTLPLHLSGGAQVFAFYRPRAEGEGVVWTALPRETPPGRHDASIDLGGGAQPVVLDVEPRQLVRFEPSQISVTSAAGARPDAVVIARNAGDVSLEIPAAGTANLTGDDAFDNAVKRAVRNAERDLLARLLEELAVESAGTLRVEVQSGAGALDVGAARELQLALQIPGELQPNRTYDGAWNFDGGSLEISVRTEESVS
jgi:hypothetical protein